jgi:DNA replication protein DnaC
MTDTDWGHSRAGSLDIEADAYDHFLWADQSERQAVLDATSREGFGSPDIQWDFLQRTDVALRVVGRNTPATFQRRLSLHSSISGWLEAKRRGVPGDLLLLGNVGTGKTQQIWTIYRYIWLAHAQGRWPVTVASMNNGPMRVETTSAVLTRLRAWGNIGKALDNIEDDPHVLMQRLTDAPLLALDDVGTKTVDETDVDHLFALIDTRWANQRPSIVSSNLTIKELTAALGERIVSRVKDGSTLVTIEGLDRRAPAA